MYWKHQQALVETDSIGEGTRIGALAYVHAKAIIGEQCEIGDGASIGAGVTLGRHVTVEKGAQLNGTLTVEDGVRIGPNAYFTGQEFPRAEQSTGETVVRRAALVGGNACVQVGVMIGENSVVQPGSVVARNIPPFAIVAGNPAVIVGYREAMQLTLVAPAAPAPRQPVMATQVPGVTLHWLPLIEDLRGRLSFGEIGRHVPFEVKRYFVVFDISSQEVRGEHAHKEQHQFLICVKGHISVVADDGQRRQEFVLNSPAMGLHLPPMVWAVQYKHSPDAILLALVSDLYDPADYIRNYSDFLAFSRK